MLTDEELDSKIATVCSELEDVTNPSDTVDTVEYVRRVFDKCVAALDDNGVSHADLPTNEVIEDLETDEVVSITSNVSVGDEDLEFTFEYSRIPSGSFVIFADLDFKYVDDEVEDDEEPADFDA